MNIFDIYLEKILDLVNLLKKKKSIELPNKLLKYYENKEIEQNIINVDIPPINFDCDISSNVAMVLSKPSKKSPFEIGEMIIPLLKDKNIETISIVKPGFINIKFSFFFWNNFAEKIFNDNTFGINKNESKKKYLIEFVSANPTGPLHVGHCRGAILGDVISNILIFNKHKVSKEYYVNDYGNQIISFTKSVYLRIREILNNEKFPLENTNLYPGDYVIEIARNIINENKNMNFENFEKISKLLTQLSILQSLKMIKINLKNLGIIHDNFVSETDIVNNNEVKQVVEKLKNKNLIYEGKIKAPIGEDKKKWVERKQLLFKSTNFGDDKDRSLQKEDNSWTYFASDVAYHHNKLNRDFDLLINILGADHAGYTKRIVSVVEALSEKKNKLTCKVSQLVKLIKNGKPFKMSKRKGDYITVEDLILEVGKDATRFIMLNRSSDVELDFDFAKIKEKSKENPLYYVQYCYARISSVFRHVNLDIKENIRIKDFNLHFNQHELKIFKKISQWPICIDLSSKKLEPHRIPIFLYELAAEFHSYWNRGKNDESFRLINKEKKISESKIVFLKIVSNVIKSGMNIVGVNTPERM